MEIIELAGVHAEGEIGRVLIKGAPAIPGHTLREKMDYLNHVDDSLIRRCLFEPRGSANMTVNLLLEPVDASADIAFIPLQPDGAHALSGSNSICVATAALEMGTIVMHEPLTTVVIETPAGRVEARAECRAGKCERVTVKMAPSFVEHLDHPLEVPGLGQLNVDVAYGGCFFVLVEAEQLGVRLVKQAARRLVELAAVIKQAAREQIHLAQRPEMGTCKIEYVMFTDNEDGKRLNCNIIHPGRVDRSPCGTGSGARLATLHRRGLVALNQPVTFHSLIGSTFECRIVEEAEPLSGNITHEISGRAWLYSHEKYWADTKDPYACGYVLSDTWGPDAD